jgi:DNA-binding MarR family transcriptional regulator
MDESLQELWISFAQLRILELLDVHHDLHLSELARRLRVTRQATRVTVAKLECAGLVHVEREAHASYVMISDLGRTRLRRFRAATHPIPDALENEFPPGRIAGLIRRLRTAEDCLESPQEPLWWLSA